jgi:hypothetical protein
MSLLFDEWKKGSWLAGFSTRNRCWSLKERSCNIKLVLVGLSGAVSTFPTEAFQDDSRLDSLSFH